MPLYSFPLHFCFPFSLQTEQGYVSTLFECVCRCVVSLPEERSELHPLFFFLINSIFPHVLTWWELPQSASLRKHRWWFFNIFLSTEPPAPKPSKFVWFAVKTCDIIFKTISIPKLEPKLHSKLLSFHLLCILCSFWCLFFCLFFV